MNSKKFKIKIIKKIKKKIRFYKMKITKYSLNIKNINKQLNIK